MAHEVCTAHLLWETQNKSDAACQDQPLDGAGRIVLSKAKVGGYEGEACRGVTCRKAMPAAAISNPQVPVRYVGRHPAKRLKVPWAAGLTDAFDQSHSQQSAQDR